MKYIELYGISQNNLKNIDVKIKLNAITVVCGPSGSGKSSLAFDTIFAEGQRRYIESLSNYTKQFLNKSPKPQVESVKNIPPALALEQKNSVKNSRSTVGTSTEILDYLKLLYEKLGQVRCPTHDIILEKDSPSSGAEKVLTKFSDQRGYILCPIYEKLRILKGQDLLKYLKKQSYLRIYIPNKKNTIELTDLDDAKIIKNGPPKKDFYVVVDRMGFSAESNSRLVDSINHSYELSVQVNTLIHHRRAKVITTGGDFIYLDEALSCNQCLHTFPEISHQLLSFNSPVGACEECSGFGNILSIDESKIIPNPKLSINQGVLYPFSLPSAAKDRSKLKKACKEDGIDLDTPWEKLSKKHQDMIWNGTKKFYGVLGLFKYLERKKYKMHVRVFLSRHKSPTPCEACQGTRLKSFARQIYFREKNISDLCEMTIGNAYDFFNNVKLNKYEQTVAKDLFEQIQKRLLFLNQIGVSYLSLDRPTKTLSGGESQRLNLAKQLGTGLSQTLYVLDEPTVGLHSRDTNNLIHLLKQLRDLGNTLVIVEHDEEVIKNADHIIEIGPLSGHRGGEVCVDEPIKAFKNNSNSMTSNYVYHKQKIKSFEKRPVNIKTYKYLVELTGCTGNNLKNVNLKLPLNRLVTISGVSGSGKSSLISGTLYPALARKMNLEFNKSLPFKKLSGDQLLKDLILIDQSPVGKTTRSNPVTYLKIFDLIRKLMSQTAAARLHGYTPGHFSLNVDGGRCPTCQGLGVEIVDMHFLDDIEVPCDECNGTKYRKEVLEVTFQNKNINNILSLTVDEALDFFKIQANIRRPLLLLKEVGLGYIQLGQSASSLSGGESQRLKVAKKIFASKHKNTLFILDEPTTGLHYKEVEILSELLHKIVDTGNSVIVVEHNLEIIKNSDYIIDIGPEAEYSGGKIMFEGTPEQMLRKKSGHTALALQQSMN